MDPPPPPPEDDDIPPPPPPPGDDEETSPPVVVLQNSQVNNLSSRTRTGTNRKHNIGPRRSSSKMHKSSLKVRKGSTKRKSRKGSTKPINSSRFMSPTPAKWRTRFFSLVRGSLTCYEDDDADDPLYSINLINATVYTWHGKPGRYVFCVTADDEDYTHFLEASNNRLRQAWLTSFHEHGANIIQPPKNEKTKSSVVHIKGWLKLYHVSNGSNESAFQSQLLDLYNVASTDVRNERAVREAPSRARQLSDLKKTTRLVKEKEFLAKKTASSAAAQLEKAQRTKDELKTNLDKAQEASKATRVKDTEELKNLEMDKIKKERELNRLQKLTKEQEKHLADMRIQIPQMKERVGELESQRAMVLQQTIDSVEGKVMTDGLDSLGARERTGSWANILMDPGSPEIRQTSFEEQFSLGAIQDAVIGDDITESSMDPEKKIAELTKTVNQQAMDIEELNNTQLEMDGQMILIEKETTRLQQALNKRRRQKKGFNKVPRGRRRGQTAKPLSNQKNSEQLQKELDMLNIKYQRYETRAEEMIEKLNGDVTELNARHEDEKFKQEELETTAEQMITELTTEIEELAIQLEEKQQSVNNENTHINVNETPTARDMAEIQRLHDENYQLKTRLRLRGLDPSQIDLAPKEIRIDKGTCEKLLMELEEVKEEKQVLLDEMTVQTEETKELNECLSQKIALITELEHDNGLLETKLVRLAGGTG